MTASPTLNPPTRILMGPGPSGAHPRVLRAMTAPILGHLDPEFLKIMDECHDMLRQVMCTTNEITMATPGTGTSGMGSSGTAGSSGTGSSGPTGGIAPTSDGTTDIKTGQPETTR